MQKISTLTLFTSLSLLMPGVVHAEASENQTDRYYDPVSGQFITQEEMNAQPTRELLLEVKVKNLILGDLYAQEVEGQLWASLSDVVLLLDFPIVIKTLDNQQIEANGWFIKESNLFSLTPSDINTLSNTAIPPEKILEEPETTTYQLTTDSTPKTVQGTKYINNEPHFLLKDLLSWFNIQSESDISGLTLVLEPAERLPVQEKKRRQQREAVALVSNFDAQFPREDVDYQAFSPILADVQLSARKEVDGNNTFSTSILGSGDLAYMTGRYYVNHRYDERTQDNTINASLYLERNSIEANLLGPLQATHFSIGDNRNASIANLPNTNAFGLRVSNRPYGRITNLSTTDITGLQQPGWDVELYLNGIFIGSQTVGEDGQYNFLQQPLQIGENRFTLRFFGLQGQRDELEELYVLDPAAAVGGKLIYDASLAKQDVNFADFFDNEQASNDYYRVNLHLEKGLSQNLSLTGDYSQYHFSDGELHSFIQPGVRLFWGKTLFNLNHLQDLSAGSQSQFNVSRGLGQGGNHVFNYSFQTQTEDFATDANSLTSVRQLHSIGVNGRFTAPALSYSGAASFTDRYDGTSSESVSLSLSKRFGRLSLNNNLIYSMNHQADNSSSNSMQGLANAGVNWQKFFLRGGLGYTIEPNSEIDTGFLDGQWNISNDFTTQLRYSYNAETDQGSEKMILNWRNSNFVTSFIVEHAQDDWRGQVNLQFSLGSNPITREAFMSSARISNSGALAAQVFEDLNNNQMLDENEPLIENAEVVAVQQHRRAKTDEQGMVMLTGLRGTQVTDIKVTHKSLEDPFWIPSIEGISFLPRPGLVKTLLIPVVTAGEVEGTIKYSQDLFNSPFEQGRVPLVLTNKDNGKEIETESTYDGFFLFETIPPGNYSLQVKPNFLTTKDVETRLPIPIKIDHKGTLVMGANFTLHPKGKFDYSKTPLETASTAYNIDLGEFMSEQNARTVLGALRDVFPNILSEISSRSTLEMLMLKKSANQYQLLLGPVFDLNQVKYICGSLAKENLKCTAKETLVKPLKSMVEPPEDLPFETPQALINESSKPETLNPQAFTLQLMNTSNKFGLENFIEEHQLEEARILEVVQNDEERFILSFGSYPSKKLAQDEAAQIKDRLQIKPWIRTFESIGIKAVH